MTTLSIIVPVLDEAEAIPLFYQAVEEIAPQLHVDIDYWFVDDGSTDDTLSVIQAIQSQQPQVHYISFSRNFGKEAALYAGLQHAKGDLVAVMDVDLQDPPELLVEMVARVQAGDVDAAAAQRIDRRQETFMRSFFAKRFYRWVNKISSTQLVEGARDYRVMTRQMVDAVLTLGETQRFSKGIFSWIGFRTVYLPYHDRPRVAGKTAWSFWDLWRYGIDGLIAFSTAPLALVTFLGGASFSMALIGAVFVTVRELLYPQTAAFGWPSLVVIILFFSGLQLLSLGVVGRYIAAIYLEGKKRPVYIAKDIR
jgi:glycosyltransferase involved in cell wall biosynthesis